MTKIQAGMTTEEGNGVPACEMNFEDLWQE